MPGLMDDPEFKKLSDSVAAITPQIQEALKLAKGFTAIAQSTQNGFSELKRTVEGLTANPPGGGGGGDDDEEIDLSDPQNLLGVVAEEVGKLLDERLGKFDQKLTETNRNFITDRLRTDAAKLSEDHKDFRDWDEEMGNLAKAHPTLSLKQLYNLARDENTTKAQELDKKYAPAPEKKDDGLSFFGGLRPGATKGSGSGDNAPEKLNPDEAAEKAWTETVAKFPALEKLAGDAETIV